MAFLSDLRTRFSGRAMLPMRRTDKGDGTFHQAPLILEWDGANLTQVSAKSIITTDGSAWRRPASGGFREIPASEYGYAQAYWAVVWLQRAADIRAHKISELLHKGQVVRKSDGTVIDAHPLTEALERSRRAYHHDLFRQWEYWRIITGEAFILPVQGTLPELPMLRMWYGFRVLNSLVTMPIIQSGQLIGFEYSGADYMQRYKPDELIYDYTFNPFDDHRGKSMLSATLDDMNIQRGVLIASKNYIKNGMHARVVFAAKNAAITQSEMDQLLTSLKEQTTGPGNAGRPLVLPTALESTVLNPPPPIEQQAYTRQAQQSAATATGVPLPLLVYDQNPYQLSPEQRIGWYDNSLIPEALDMAYVVDTQLLPYFDPDPDRQFILPEDDIRSSLAEPKQRAEIIQVKLHGGWMTFNQALQAEGRKPVLGGDFYMLPSGMIAVPESQLAQVSELTKPAAPMALQAVPQLPERPTPQLTTGQGLPTPPVRSVEPEVIENIVITDGADLSVQPLALAELAHWQKFWRNGTQQKRPFQHRMIADGIADELRSALSAAGTDASAMKAAFDLARARVETKAIAATRLDFEGEFETLLSAARAENIDRRNFGGRLRTLLRKYGEKAYRDGLMDGGVEIGIDEPLPEDDRGNLAVKLAEQSVYVTSFGAALYKEDRITDDLAVLKPAQWFNGSIMPLYHEGLLSADKNGMYECVGPVDDQSCETCVVAAGQRHRLREWAKADLMFPYGGAIICGQGKQCRHKHVRVTGRERGNLASIPRHTG